jgi:hypothetical protein
MKMIRFRLWHLILICISSYPILLPNASAANDYSSLNINGEIYPNSCGPEQKRFLQEQLLATGIPDAAQAWQAIYLILCASENHANFAKVGALFNKQVRITIESAADKPIFKVVAGNEKLAASIMAAAKAWDTNILTEGGKIVLHYFVNEACVKSATLLHNKSKWSVYEVGQACD